MGALTLGRGDRSRSPRSVGLTHVIDTGLPLEQARSLLEVVADFVDIWKFGFGTSYLDPTAAKKIRLFAESGIEACLGGTLLEVAWLESKTEECLAWALDMGFPFVEVSNGACKMSTAEKHRLIDAARADFTVIAEVGSKDPGDAVSPRAWADEMVGDLAAGASWGITEGRESGTVGLYTSDGSVRWPVVDAVAGAVGVERVIFEAPRRDQQAALIRRFGSNVNLGNVAPFDVLGLETLRRGLRADTLVIEEGETR